MSIGVGGRSKGSSGLSEGVSTKEGKKSKGSSQGKHYVSISCMYLARGSNVFTIFILLLLFKSHRFVFS